MRRPWPILLGARHDRGRVADAPPGVKSRRIRHNSTRRRRTTETQRAQRRQEERNKETGTTLGQARRAVSLGSLFLSVFSVLSVSLWLVFFFVGFEVNLAGGGWADDDR
jgi:hypothetical protein